MKGNSQSELQFEEAMEKLEQIVGRLESGDVPLEQAIELYQEGMQLSGLCSKKLEQVEKKIQLLVDEDGELKPQEWDPPQEAE